MHNLPWVELDKYVEVILVAEIIACQRIRELV